MLTKKNPYSSSSKNELKQSKETPNKALKTEAITSETKENAPLKKKLSKTRIIVKYDVGFQNTLYIRGKGANLSWEKGIELKNIAFDEWLWETETPFTTCEFKVLINDRFYEGGDNHTLDCGSSVQYCPKF